MQKHGHQIVWISLGLGWIFDLLFWGKPVGISFAIYVALIIGIGIAIARREGVKPARASLWLLLPITYFTVMSVIRLEPMTTFLNRSLTLLLMMILASSFSGGRWFLYQLRDYAPGLGMVVISALSRGGSLLFTSLRKPVGDDQDKPSTFKNAVPVLRGILLALPLVLFFGVLLSAADPVFSRYFTELLELFRIDLLPEYILRTIFIVIIAYLLLGVFVHTIMKSDDSKLASGKNLVRPFLGFTETGIILGSVITLFSAFVIIQIGYFFGGEANISIEGYTYSEYARRGFFELLLVSLFTLILFILMSAIAKREQSRHQQIFFGFGLALVALVGVMLYSAIQRLVLYEQAFGFTRLRTYAHVFIVWVGLLLAAIALLELLGKQRAFVFANLMAVLGFALSLNVLNVDAFIARQNISRYDQFEQFDPGIFDQRSAKVKVDIQYLATLSTDAVPAMSALYLQAQERDEQDLSEAAVQAFSCHAAQNAEYEYSLPWQSFNLSRSRAYQAWQLRSGDSQLSAQFDCPLE